MLVEDRQEQAGVRLKFFNLSRTGSAELLDRALQAFLDHPGWQELKEGIPGENEAFGPKCPIRQNYELLQVPLVRSRFRSLLELCDYNGLHVPIRQILLLLTNAILGHPDVKDRLMVASDVPKGYCGGHRLESESLQQCLRRKPLGSSATRHHDLRLFGAFPDWL